MKIVATIFLQTAVVIVGIGALAILLWEPRIEGLNEHATNFEIYFKDPFLALAYTGSLPFFIALYQAFRLLGHARQDTLISPAAMKALRMIRHCGVATAGFVMAQVTWIIVNHGNDDDAGWVFIGGPISFGAAVVVAAAFLLEGLLHTPLRRAGDQAA